MDSQKRRIVTNADNERCMPLGGCIGHVDEVNGNDAAEVPEFVPTRHELLLLARYWAGVAIEMEWRSRDTECYGSDWSRRLSFGLARVARISRCIGENETGFVVHRVADEIMADRQIRSKIYKAMHPNASDETSASGKRKNRRAAKRVKCPILKRRLRLLTIPFAPRQGHRSPSEIGLH